MALNVGLDVSFDNLLYWGGIVEKTREVKKSMKVCITGDETGCCNSQRILTLLTIQNTYAVWVQFYIMNYPKRKKEITKYVVYELLAIKILWQRLYD
jgi:hypothetical protein